MQYIVDPAPDTLGETLLRSMNYPSSFISKRSRLRPDLFVNLRLVAVATTGPVRPRRLSTPYRRDSIFTTTPYGDLMNVVAASF